MLSFEPGKHRIGHALTPRAEERERAFHTRLDSFIQGGTQEASRSMQTRLHSLRTNIEEFGGFVDAAILYVAHDEDHAVVRWKLIDRLFDKMTDLHARCCCLRSFTIGA